MQHFWPIKLLYVSNLHMHVTICYCARSNGTAVTETLFSLVAK